MKYPYNKNIGVSYARGYAKYFEVPEELRLFYYDSNGVDCTNFCSQCVWASYGGWIPGFNEKSAAENKERIKKTIRMAPFIWYGSMFFSGSNKWCRVVELYDYAISPKTFGPKAVKIYEGGWQELNPSIIFEGDVIQLVVASYTPYRYGHCLYVTQKGNSLDNILICCHSYDRKDSPLSEFSDDPLQYTKLRVLRFKEASFIK